MNFLKIALLIALLASFSFAQDKEDIKSVLMGVTKGDCGDPLSDSQTYSYRFGKVLQVLPDNRLVVRVTHSTNDSEFAHVPNSDSPNGDKLARPETFTVALVGIDPAANKSAINVFLRKRILNQEVTLTGNLIDYGARKLDALVVPADEEIDELNDYLLGQGLAKFNNFTHANVVPMTTACELKKVENLARESKAGIWAEPKKPEPATAEPKKPGAIKSVKTPARSKP